MSLGRSTDASTTACAIVTALVKMNSGLESDHF